MHRMEVLNAFYVMARQRVLIRSGGWNRENVYENGGQCCGNQHKTKRKKRKKRKKRAMMKPEKGNRTDSIAPFPCIAYTRCAFTLFDIYIYTSMHVLRQKKHESRFECFVAKANGERKMRILSHSRRRKKLKSKLDFFLFLLSDPARPPVFILWLLLCETIKSKHNRP